MEKAIDFDIQMEEIHSIIEKIDEEEHVKTTKQNNRLAEQAILGVEDLGNILGHILNKLSSEDKFRDLLTRGVIKRENYPNDPSNDSHTHKRFKIVIKKYPHDTTEKNELFDDYVETIESKGHLTKLTTALLYPEVVSIINRKLSEDGNEHRFLIENNRNVSIVISDSKYAKIFIEDGNYSHDSVGKITLEL